MGLLARPLCNMGEKDLSIKKWTGTVLHNTSIRLGKTAVSFSHCDQLLRKLPYTMREVFC